MRKFTFSFFSSVIFLSVTALDILLTLIVGMRVDTLLVPCTIATPMYVDSQEP